uniref:Uncharacterized protein n=1 Tax=Anguilla anguilla TaxID=7936 RepID=A0A0E9RP17_ANGAN
MYPFLHPGPLINNISKVKGQLGFMKQISIFKPVVLKLGPGGTTAGFHSSCNCKFGLGFS